MADGDAEYTQPIKSPRAIGPAVILGGGLAGLIGGILMALAMTGYDTAIGAGGSYFMQEVAATFYGPMAMIGGVGVTVIGVLTFLGIASFIGMVYAALVFRLNSTFLTFFMGIAFGIGVWAVMNYVFVPVFDSTMMYRLALIPVFWFFVHWIYGAFTGWLSPVFHRAFAGRRVTIRTAPPLRRSA